MRIGLIKVPLSTSLFACSVQTLSVETSAMSSVWLHISVTQFHLQAMNAAIIFVTIIFSWPAMLKQSIVRISGMPSTCSPPSPPSPHMHTFDLYSCFSQWTCSTLLACLLGQRNTFCFGESVLNDNFYSNSTINIVDFSWPLTI